MNAPGFHHSGDGALRPFALLAEALRYPAPGRLAVLQAGWVSLPQSALRDRVSAFLVAIQGMTLSAWEELYTHTWDIDPPAAPYVGYQLWGESYKRGNFMALMNRELRACHVDLEGELPDHLAPVLVYLDGAPHPSADLLVALEPAVRKMRQALGKADPDNPYLALLDAILLSVQGLAIQT